MQEVAIAILLLDIVLLSKVSLSFFADGSAPAAAVQAVAIPSLER
jgi:hypothetical protein